MEKKKKKVMIMLFNVNLACRLRCIVLCEKCEDEEMTSHKNDVIIKAVEKEIQKSERNSHLSIAQKALTKIE